MRRRYHVRRPRRVTTYRGVSRRNRHLPRPSATAGRPGSRRGVVDEADKATDTHEACRNPDRRVERVRLTAPSPGQRPAHTSGPAAGAGATGAHLRPAAAAEVAAGHLHHIGQAPVRPARTSDLPQASVRPARTCDPPQASGFAAKSMSAVLTMPAVRPGALWYCQYMLVWAMTLSGVGAPYAERSSVVWASLTSVAS
jgi:hypothetical protein